MASELELQRLSLVTCFASRRKQCCGSFQAPPVQMLPVMLASCPNAHPYSVLFKIHTSNTVPTMTAMGMYLRMSACSRSISAPSMTSYIGEKWQVYELCHLTEGVQQEQAALYLSMQVLSNSCILFGLCRQCIADLRHACNRKAGH